MENETYKNYKQWKFWSSENFLKPSPQEVSYFLGEMRGFNLKNRKILEIGFGNGSFLGFAIAQGADVYGTEILEPALQSAMTFGIKLLPTDISTSIDDYSGTFDAIFAFDVLEHLSISEIEQMLDNIAKMLKPGGRFVARFPNGQSPFGRVWQHGDCTHRSTLSALILRQLIIGRPFSVIHAGDPFKEYHGTAINKVTDFIRYRLQELIIWLLHKIFKFSDPLALNTVVVFARS